MNNLRTFFNIGGIILMVFLGVYCITKFINVNNKDIQYHQLIEAQAKKKESVHDKMWKTLTTKAQVTEEYAASFDSIYTHIIAGRYANGNGEFMQWIKESNPNFDSSLYHDLMQSIDACRNEFLAVQNLEIDIAREHNAFIQRIPNCFFVRCNENINVTVVSSSRSKEAMNSGLDDDVNLFKR